MRPGSYINSLARTADGSIFAATETGLYRNNPTTGAWVQVSGVPNTPFSETVFLARDGSLYYNVYYSYAYKSIDNGNSWSTLTALGTLDVHEMVETPDERLFLAAENFPSRVFSSSDHGATWQVQTIPAASYYQDLALGTSGEVYVSGVAFVYRITNGAVDVAILGNPAGGFNEERVYGIEQAPDGHLLAVYQHTLYRSDIAVPEPGVATCLLVLCVASARKLRRRRAL